MVIYLFMFSEKQNTGVCVLTVCACWFEHLRTCGMSVDKNVPVCETNWCWVTHTVQGNCLCGHRPSVWKVFRVKQNMSHGHMQ